MRRILQIDLPVDFDDSIPTESQEAYMASLGQEITRLIKNYQSWKKEKQNLSIQEMEDQLQQELSQSSDPS